MKAHRLCVPLNSRLESNKEEEEDLNLGDGNAAKVDSPLAHVEDNGNPNLEMGKLT